MLEIRIPQNELFDEKTQEFITVNAQTLTLEHSLLSISKWESKWHIPFLDKKEKTPEQLLDYIRCMSISKNVDPNVLKAIAPTQMKEINDYINNPMTASTVHTPQRGGGREVVTSELIYYWMITSGIPFECEKWHINRLLMLIKICGAKSGSDKKMSRGQVMKQNAALNAARRKKYHSKG